MVSSNFQKTFLMFWHKIRGVSYYLKKKKFLSKNAYHKVSMFLKLPPIIFVFFNHKLIFVLKQTFKKKFCRKKIIFCVYNVVLDILILDFFPFLFIIFFINAKNFYFFV